MSGRSPPIIDRLLQTKIFNFPNKKDYYPFIWIKVLKFKNDSEYFYCLDEYHYTNGAFYSLLQKIL